MEELPGRIAGLSSAQRAVPERRLRDKASTLAPQRIPRRNPDEPCPLSFAQERLWFLDQWHPGIPVYNVATHLQLSGPVDLQALEQSANEIIRRHEALRTTFRLIDGTPVQVIAPHLSIPVPVVDLEPLTDVDRGPALARHAGDEVRIPFNLADGPLLRTTLFRLGEYDHVLLLVMHHIVSDGESTDIFFRELAVLYQAFRDGAPSPLSELPIQYGDFASWQRKRLETSLTSHLSYWKRTLESIPTELGLPSARPRPPVQSFRGAVHSFSLSRELSDAIQALSRREGVTLFMTLLAAFKILLNRYTAETDLVVGSPIAHRAQTETEGLIGFFVNILVLRSNLSGDPRVLDLLRRIRTVALGAYAHQDLPFERLVAELHPQRSLDRNPLFQVMFAFQGSHALIPLATTGSPAASVPLSTGTAKFDLALSVVDTGHGLTCTVEYSTDLFDEALMVRLGCHYEVLLAGMTANPARRLSELPMLTAAENRQILETWNDTSLPDWP